MTLMTKFEDATTGNVVYCNPNTVQYVMHQEGGNTYIVYESPTDGNLVGRNGIKVRCESQKVRRKLPLYATADWFIRIVIAAFAGFGSIYGSIMLAT